MADQEHIQARLQNIRAVEPILSAMRTISLGSWQGAINRQARLRPFSERLLALLPPILPYLARRRRSKTGPAAGRIAVLVIGSERGLCGAFNLNLAAYAQTCLAQRRTQGVHIELETLGRRIKRILTRRGVEIIQARSLPTTSLPGRELATSLVDRWLVRYEAYQIDAVDIVYNAYRNSTLYEPTTVRLIPPTLPDIDVQRQEWPSPYVDTDLLSLYTHIVRLWMSTEMYRILLDSAAAEHSARFRLMEGATQNCQRLIDELTLALQSARQQAITAEMQELAAGAGLIGGSKG